MGYKDPSYQDRAKSALEAKQKALDQLRAKPAADPAALAERAARRSEKDAAEAAKRAERKAAQEQAKAEKAAAAKARAAPVLTDEERKAARDARYAARKARK